MYEAETPTIVRSAGVEGKWEVSRKLKPFGNGGQILQEYGERLKRLLPIASSHFLADCRNFFVRRT